ncbi:RND transporter, partial [Thiococcus pfennigii]|nr:RND transporter [Thiococcus pfennigii]
LDVEVLGARREADGRERLPVRSPQLATGDLMVTTHLPNAIDGLRVETVGEVADPPGGAADPVVGR